MKIQHSPAVASHLDAIRAHTDRLAKVHAEAGAHALELEARLVALRADLEKAEREAAAIPKRREKMDKAIASAEMKKAQALGVLSARYTAADAARKAMLLELGGVA